MVLAPTIANCSLFNIGAIILRPDIYVDQLKTSVVDGRQLTSLGWRFHHALCICFFLCLSVCVFCGSLLCLYCLPFFLFFSSFFFLSSVLPLSVFLFRLFSFFLSFSLFQCLFHLLFSFSLSFSLPFSVFLSFCPSLYFLSFSLSFSSLNFRIFQRKWPNIFPKVLQNSLFLLFIEQTKY